MIRSYRRIVFTAAICAAVSPRLTAQSGASLRGTVTDSVTGSPVVGARIAVWCTGCRGRYPTDSAGHYRLDRLSPGPAKFEVHCPSATGIGAEIMSGVIDIGPGGETIVDVRVPRGQCTEPAYSERRGVFRGYWTPGYESSAFVPCADSALGVPAPLLPGKRLYPTSAWATLHEGAWSPSAWPLGAPLEADGNATYYVVWRGVLKGPGQYGHMGVSAFAMGIDSILSVSARGPADCRTGATSSTSRARRTDR